MLVGLLLLLSAAVGYNLGVVLQASVAKRADASLSMRPRLIVWLLSSRRWLLGLGLVLAAWIFQVAALRSLPLEVVQPGLACGLIFLLVYANRTGGARTTLRDLAGASALIVGVALVSARASAPGTPDASLSRWTLAVTPLVAVVAAPYVMSFAGRRPSWVWMAASTGSAYAITSLTTALVARWLDHRMLAAAIAAVGATAVAGLVGFLAETSAFQSGEVTAVVPVMLFIDTFVPVLIAPVLFHERWPSGIGGRIVIASGLAIAAAGTIALASSPRIASLRASPA